MHSDMVLEIIDLSSISGIIVATLFILEIIKRLTRNILALQKVPLWCYALVVSAILAFIANSYLETDLGEPLLPGTLGTVIWKSIIGALGASGFYSWLRTPDANPQNTKNIGA